jgi:hypothetical protein
MFSRPQKAANSANKVDFEFFLRVFHGFESLSA